MQAQYLSPPSWIFRYPNKNEIFNSRYFGFTLNRCYIQPLPNVVKDEKIILTSAHEEIKQQSGTAPMGKDAVKQSPVNR